MRTGASILVATVLMLGASRASAQAAVSAAEGEAELDRKLKARLRALREEPGGVAHFMGSIGLGKGLRFNNPYRLSTQLGDDAASASLTASYVDVGLAGAYGPADGVRHGVALHLGGSVQGVSQAYITPTYLATWRPEPSWMALGRLGPSVVLTPDPNIGAELALGGVWFATAGLGVSAESLLDVFYGAATIDSVAAVYPVVSLQLSLVIDAEVLP